MIQKHCNFVSLEDIPFAQDREYRILKNTFINKIMISIVMQNIEVFEM